MPCQGTVVQLPETESLAKKSQQSLAGGLWDGLDFRQAGRSYDELRRDRVQADSGLVRRRQRSRDAVGVEARWEFVMLDQFSRCDVEIDFGDVDYLAGQNYVGYMVDQEFDLLAGYNEFNVSLIDGDDCFELVRQADHAQLGAARECCSKIRFVER